jgi:sarcosine oxidase
VALTQDFLPHLHELAPGLHAALGYNGRGVAMATALGTLLARRAAGEPADALPFATSALRTIPFHGLRNLYVAAARTHYRLRDVTA